MAVITGSARLDNRAELVAELGGAGDLELCLRAYARWGDASPERLLGDFAYAIDDRSAGRVFAARDALGVRPLSYRAGPAGIAVAASAREVAAIDRRPLDVSEVRVADVLVGELECADRTSTMYRDVFRLAPGHTLVFDGRGVAIRPYWTPDGTQECEARSDAEHEEAFRSVFEQAVRCRLDSRTASMLSGGLDSSAIVAVASAARLAAGGPALTTLSAVVSDAGCEESRSVRRVLALPGLAPVLIRREDVGAYAGAIQAHLEGAEEPFDVSMIIPLLAYVEARRCGFTAVLDGVDGDCVASLEPDYLVGLLRAGAWGRGIREAAGIAAFYRETHAPWSSAPRLLARQASRAFAPRWAASAYRRMAGRRRIDAALEDSIVRRDLAIRARLPERLLRLWSLRTQTGRDLRARHAAELAHPQIAAALERYHRVAASQGIEARHPFFDRRLVEWCLALPWDQKIRDGWSKSIVRRALRHALPADVLWRRGRWVRLGPVFLASAIAALRATLDAAIEGGLDELAPYVDRRRLGRAIAGYRAGNDAAAETVWQAVALDSWLRSSRATRYDRAIVADGPAPGHALSAPGEIVTRS